MTSPRISETRPKALIALSEQLLSRAAGSPRRRLCGVICLVKVIHGRRWREHRVQGSLPTPMARGRRSTKRCLNRHRRLPGLVDEVRKNPLSGLGDRDPQAHQCRLRRESLFPQGSTDVLPLNVAADAPEAGNSIKCAWSQPPRRRTCCGSGPTIGFCIGVTTSLHPCAFRTP